ncbi:Long-chain-fatty-acid--CoA ligase [Pelotomaculum sp. FP]|uniref:AMP-binding protein n=1 Tax=Pelotomaculum sp. FP TaxID=261474 RepID=UPI001065D038|nr:AMP-binding protein [Pelotomaculum sp. FP]TEB14634.1 Long-chain-fatty-acid--CoA ligase [Pelotomaculum sp. FP]
MGAFDKTTVAELLDRTSMHYPDNDALIYTDRGLKYSYKEFRELCNQFAKGLLKLGIKKGEHIAVWATNVPEWVITQFGSARIGAVLVAVNYGFELLELEYQLKQSDATTLIMIEGSKNSHFRSIINELCPELSECKPGELVSEKLPLLKNVIMIGNNKYPGMFSWDDVLKAGEDVSDEELEDRSATLDPDDAVVMVFTSGTTSRPKRVMLTHHAIIENARAQAECLNLGPSDRMCIAVPFFHCKGAVSSNLCCVVTGAVMVPVEIFDAAQVLKTVEKERCTVLHGVPTMFILELEEMEKGKYDVSSLRTGMVAGDGCSPDVIKKIAKVMNMPEVITAYGQSEASPCITSTRTSDPIEIRATTVGQALPGVEVKIVDPKTGEEVPRGAHGEIWARGYNITKGYYKMPEATASKIDSNGWVHTRDLGVMDENGYCKIICRLKDIIICGGETILPKEVEEFLRIHPLIKDVQIVGVPSEKFGEEVMAFIRVQEGYALTPESVQNFCKGQIASWKIPKYVVFVEDYPYTTSGKVHKLKLREMAAEMLKSQKCSKIK